MRNGIFFLLATGFLFTVFQGAMAQESTPPAPEATEKKPIKIRKPAGPPEASSWSKASPDADVNSLHFRSELSETGMMKGATRNPRSPKTYDIYLINMNGENRMFSLSETTKYAKDGRLTTEPDLRAGDIVTVYHKGYPPEAILVVTEIPANSVPIDHAEIGTIDQIFPEKDTIIVRTANGDQSFLLTSNTELRHNGRRIAASDLQNGLRAIIFYTIEPIFRSKVASAVVIKDGQN